MRFIYFLIGWTSMTLGFAGIFLPVLPTTPFMLLAAYCFSRSSKKLHHWLITRKNIGPLILDWERNRVIRPKAKRTATLLIVPLFTYSAIWVADALLVRAILAVTGAGILAFIWSQKSHPSAEAPCSTERLLNPDQG